MSRRYSKRQGCRGPHVWRIPEPSGSEIECSQCGRLLSRVEIDATDYMEWSIKRSLRKRQPELVGAFERFMKWEPPRPAPEALDLSRVLHETL